MAEKETVGVRLPTDKVNRIEQMAEEKDISKSDATRRLIRKGLDLEEMGLSVTGVTHDDGNEDSVHTAGMPPLSKLAYDLSQALAIALMTTMFLVAFGGV